jgi:predicted Zn-dependent protease
MKRVFILIVSVMFSITVFSQNVQDAKLLVYHERYSSASDVLHAVLKNETNNEEAWYLLTRAYLEQDKIKEIKDSLQKAPDEVKAKPLFECAYGNVLLKENNAAGAKQYFDKALKETKQKDPQILEAIARAYINVKDADAAYAT